MGGLWTVFIGTVGFGAAGEAARRYRGFKANRAAMLYAARNAGFWTDRRIIRTEAATTAAFMAVPFTAIILALATNQGGFLYAYLGLLGYAALVFTVMLAFRPEPPQ